MLLIDRLITHLAHFRRHGGNDEGCLDSMLSSSIYDVSPVVPLMDSYTDAADLGIPRHPPHDPVWVEWEDNSPDWQGGVSEDRIGAFFTSLPKEAVASIFRRGQPTDLRHRPDKPLNFEEYDEFYLSVSFRYNRTPHNMLQTYDGQVLWMGRNSMATLSHVSLRTQPGERMNSIGLPVAAMQIDQDGRWGVDVVPWVAFMSFALLHCRNVVTEDCAPDEVTQRRVKKSGNPPRVSYKVLRVKVPAEIRKKSVVANTEEAAAARRFHLCRGHFKNLQHDRYKEKGWHWWPAHWRGDPDRGEVVKDYELRGER